jgi:restriction endonuclease Mrr
MQLFIGMMHHHGAGEGIYVTTSEFTKSATDLAKRSRILLIDGSELSKQLRDFDPDRLI